MQLRVYTLTTLLLAACSGASNDESSGETGATSDASGGGSSGDVPTTGGGPLCGNGMLDEGEVCDGAELDGKACGDVDPALPLGSLACSGACTFDTSMCMAAGAAFVALNEVTSLGAETGPYAGLGDAIELYNPGDAAVDLSGWQLSDDTMFPVDKTYVFPDGTTLAPGGYLVLTSYDDVAMTGELPFGLSSSNSETVTLADADGETVDQVIFSGLDAQVSYCRLPDGTGAWQLCDSSLGGANLAASQVCGNGELEGDEPCDGADLGGATCQSLGFAGGALACTADCALDPATCDSATGLVLNELESNEDQIELLNGGAMPIDISGWILTDDPAGPNYDPVADVEKLIFPPNSILMPGVYLIVAKGDLPGQHPFGLSAAGDTVTLLDDTYALVDQVTYGPELASVSYCRIPDGPGNPWAADCVPTLGGPNQKP